MVGFILLLLILISIWIGLLSGADIQDVKQNWPKYRCRPNIMPFASFYGHNTAENFQFCLMNMFGDEMGTALGPVFQILGQLISSLVLLIQVANSIRLQFATMMGGVNTLFSNFADRFKQLMSAVQMSAYRMKLIMGRLYGAFFAMIYMSIAGMTAMQNFTETSLFSFLDTFCFDPDTHVLIESKGSIAVKDVRIGDIFEKTGGKVTSAFQFKADGQPMVELPGKIIVSTNHFINYRGAWIPAGSHPDAKQIDSWAGGKERPLICFNTSDHKIPVGEYVFLDYDETEEGDEKTMEWIDEKLNGYKTKRLRDYSYSSCAHASTLVRMADGSSKSIVDIQLGDRLTTGTVTGLVKKVVTSECELPSGDLCAPGLCCWTGQKWERAGERYEIHETKPQIMYSLVVLHSATFETAKGAFVRDYVEVHSPEAEQFYAEAIATASKGEGVPVY